VKILIASTPATGHLNPLLTIGRILIAEGHEVVGLSGSALREPIEGIGAEFRCLYAVDGSEFRVSTRHPDLGAFHRRPSDRSEASPAPGLGI